MKRKASTILYATGFIVLTLFIMQCSVPPEITSISPDALIVDVRTAEEFGEQHATDAINIPLNQVEQRISEFGNPDTEIIVYCGKGVRSKKAKQILISKGYKNVSNGGGLDDMLQMKRRPK